MGVVEGDLEALCSLAEASLIRISLGLCLLFLLLLLCLKLLALLRDTLALSLALASVAVDTVVEMVPDSLSVCEPAPR